MRIQRNIRASLLLGIGFVFALGQANADLYQITSQSAFNADTTGLTTVYWPNTPPPNGTDYVGNPHSPSSNLALATNTGGSFMIVNYDASGNPVSAGSQTSMITASFSPAVTAVSENITDASSTFQATLTLSNGAQYVLSDLPPFPSTTFVGFVATGGLTISSLSFLDTPESGMPNPELDSIQYGTASLTPGPEFKVAIREVTPEPGLYAALAIALSSLLIFSRHKRKA